MFQKLKLGKQHLIICCAALCVPVLTALLLVNSTSANALYVLSDQETSITLDGTYTESIIMQRLVTVSGADSTDPNIQLKSGHSVFILYHGATLSTVSRDESVSQLLSRMKIVPGPLESIGVDGSGDSIKITVASRLVCYTTEKEIFPVQTEYVDRYDQPVGYENLLTSGTDGYSDHVYEVIYEDGQLASRQLVETIHHPGEPTRIERGTLVTQARADDNIVSVIENGDGSGYLIMASGDSLHFVKALSVTATAYTTGYDGVGTRTASGTTVQVGSIAVDRSVISLGSKLVVSTSRGTYVGTAEDTGVRGKKVDLYMNSYEQCIQFGRRSGTVYLLG